MPPDDTATSAKRALRSPKRFVCLAMKAGTFLIFFARCVLKGLPRRSGFACFCELLVFTSCFRLRTHGSGSSKLRRIISPPPPLSPPHRGHASETCTKSLWIVLMMRRLARSKGAPAICVTASRTLSNVVSIPRSRKRRQTVIRETNCWRTACSQSIHSAGSSDKQGLHSTALLSACSPDGAASPRGGAADASEPPQRPESRISDILPTLPRMSPNTLFFVNSYFLKKQKSEKKTNKKNSRPDASSVAA